MKVKIKSLAEEARIIRREEKDPRNIRLRSSLRGHRTWKIRRESRAALLAYGFLRGSSYNEMESNPHNPPNWDRVRRLVKKYGVMPVWTGYSPDKSYSKRKKDESERLEAWIEESKNHLS